MTEEKEKRLHQRIPFRIAVEDAIRKELPIYYSENISESGVLLESKVLFSKESKIKVGKKVNLTFYLPESKGVVKAKGEIVRIADKPNKDDSENVEFITKVGIRFLELDTKTKKELKKIINPNEEYVIQSK